MSKLTFLVLLGRVNDKSSHDSIPFAFFVGEREDSSHYKGLASSSSARVISREGQNGPKSAYEAKMSTILLLYLSVLGSVSF